MKMTRLLFAGLMATAHTAIADVTTLYTKDTMPPSFALSTEWWTNSVGEVFSWNDCNDGNSIAYFHNLATGGGSFTLNGSANDQFKMYSLVADIPGWLMFDLRYTPLLIGAGGVDVKNGRYFIGSNQYKTEVHLTANQTWTGSGTANNLLFSIGTVRMQYCSSTLFADEGVTALNITGKLHPHLFSPSNELQNVTVTVSDSAKLWLIDVADARLNAKKLVMSGDGVHMAFGGVSPAKSWNGSDSASWCPTNIVAVDNAHLAPEVELAAGADISAVGGIYAISNLVVSGTQGSVISGDLVFTQAINRVTFANEGANLTFSTANSVADGVAAGFAVDGPGTLFVEDLAPFTGALEISDGAVFVYTQSETAETLSMNLSGGGTLRVATGSNLFYVPTAKMADFTGNFEVVSGTLVLDSELEAGRVIVDGGSVIYASTDPSVVTDEVRSESAITVASNETLLVYGNGLTAATALTMAGGTVRFCQSATVASPVTISAPGSSFVADGLAVTGTVSGYITSHMYDNNKTLVTAGTILAGQGCIRLTGGGSFQWKANPLRSLDGEAVFDGGTWEFYSCGSMGLHQTKPYSSTALDATYGRRWTVRNGATLKIYGANNDTYQTNIEVKGNEYSSTIYNTREAFLDIENGGTVELGSRGGVVAGWVKARGTIRVANGGVLKSTNPLSIIRIGHSQYAWGVLRLQEGGQVEISAPIQRYFYSKSANQQPQGNFIWEGGTLKVTNNFSNDQLAIFSTASTPPASDDPAVINGLRVWTKIVGDSCVLDLTDLPVRETPLANVPAGYDRAEWFGTGTLTVKGGKTFKMNSFASGIGLVLEGAGTKVLFPDDAQFHDYEKCVVTENVTPGPAHYSTFSNLLSAVALKSFAAKGLGVSLVSENATNTLSIATATALPDGEFSNGTITFPGGLSVTNLTFAEGSVIGGDSAFPALHVEEDIVLPSSLLYYSAAGGGTMAFTAFTASGSVGSTPATLTKVQAKSLRPQFSQAGKFIDFSLVGGLILIR